jgi:3-deoxy-manno-octulosonate cytidylyltransferase (CMP-KDO synthetase)
MKIVGIIPARYGSTRFPGKVLVDLAGKPMIQHVYERACQVTAFADVLVATDDPRVQQAVQAFGGQVRMTSPNHPSGTDRLAEIAQTLDADILVNVQGDEPLIQPAMIMQALQPVLHEPDIAIGTLKHRITTSDALLNPNVVKVVTDQAGRALYFSRSPIPYLKSQDVRGVGFQTFTFYRHIGLYAYRREFLLQFVTLPPSPLELAEGLEQLRALEHGYRIGVVETTYAAIGVDAPEDVARIINLLQQANPQ